MNTNFLKDEQLACDFLSEGAFIQTAMGTYKLFIGRLQGHSNLETALKVDQCVMYNPQFWQFLNMNNSPVSYYTAVKVYELNFDQFSQFIQSVDSILMAAQSTYEWYEQSQIDFKQQFDWIQNQIAENKIQKALPISVLEGQGNIKSNLARIILKLINIKSPNFAYGRWDQENGVIGYTPELISEWSLEKSELKTMALAGTWKKKTELDAHTDIKADYNFSDEKTNIEHQVVVADIENQLSDINLISRSETYVVELPYLFHLKTDFTYQCKDIDSFQKMVKQLHPTAALGVYPRTQSSMVEFSNLNCQKQREYFAAPFGFYEKDSGFFLAAIRNVSWSQDKLQIVAGCGVTKDSVFQDEWSEIQAKQESVKKMLGLTN